MIFCPTNVAGAFEIRPELIHDERGWFTRTWCQREFESHGLNPRIAQCNLSFNPRKGTLRGMHYQVGEHAEAKLVRCTRGSIFDVALDIRPSSPTFKKWAAVVLKADASNMFYIPEGCAHGFLTLADETEVFYQISEFYHPESGRGVRWDDPAFGVEWPARVEVISDRDRTYPNIE